MEYLARHVVDMWMWTLRQRHNTPCVPLIITFRCNNEGTGDQPHCSGVGTRSQPCSRPNPPHINLAVSAGIVRDTDKAVDGGMLGHAPHFGHLAPGSDPRLT